jgi:hypothetical protein
MTLQEQIAHIDRLILFIETELPRYVETVAATDLAALIADRVITTGEDKDGAKFSPYSTNPDNAKNYVGKSRNQSAERKVKALQRAGTALSYKTFRELNNLQSDFKRFEFTGEMWKKFGVIRATLTAERFHIIIGGTTPEAQDKIDSNSDYENQSIIEASRAEVLIVEKTSFYWLEDQSKRILAV